MVTSPDVSIYQGALFIQISSSISKVDVEVSVKVQPIPIPVPTSYHLCI